MKILTNPQSNEKNLKEIIAEALSCKYKGAMVCVIELSGRPIKTPRGIVMIPFKSPFYRKGMSDILMFYKGFFFAFEVKKKQEYAWFSKKLNNILINGPKNKKEEHFFEQYMFLCDIKKNGGGAAFVYCLEQATKIVDNALLDIKKE